MVREDGGERNSGECDGGGCPYGGDGGGSSGESGGQSLTELGAGLGTVLPFVRDGGSAARVALSPLFGADAAGFHQADSSFNWPSSPHPMGVAAAVSE